MKYIKEREKNMSGKMTCVTKKVAILVPCLTKPVQYKNEYNTSL